MRSWTGFMVVIPFCLLLTACGNESDGQKAEPETHVWQGQVDALEKAKGVEATMQTAADQQRQLLEQPGH